ncbi:hypothetical protein JCM8208_005074 [Rhodotorula glutinis]
MSIDLEWSALDAHLTLACTRFLSDAFNTAPTPDFVGPLEVTAFSFGDAHPQLTLVDIRDIQHEFLHPQQGDDPDGDDLDDNGERAFPLPSPPPLERPPPTWHSHTYPSSPPASISGTSWSGFGPLGGGPGGAAGLFSPGLLHHQHPGGVGLSALAGGALGGQGPGASRHGGRGAGSRSRSRSPAAAGGHGHPPLAAGAGAHPLAQHDLHSQHTHTHPHSYAAPSPSPSLSSLPPLPPPSSAPSPSFQVHLRLSYSGNLSLGIATALRINYPSSSFMSLPLSLTLTGLALEGTLVVAFEGGRRRVHLSLLEPDPSSIDDVNALPGDSPTKPFARLHGSSGPAGAGSGSGSGARSTPGARVLRAAHVESEVGQADKHVLRNVGKVEKFVVDVARKTLENELVFPNFQTIVF